MQHIRFEERWKQRESVKISGASVQALASLCAAGTGY